MATFLIELVRKSIPFTRSCTLFFVVHLAIAFLVCIESKSHSTCQLFFKHVRQNVVSQQNCLKNRPLNFQRKTITNSLIHGRGIKRSCNSWRFDVNFVRFWQCSIHFAFMSFLLQRTWSPPLVHYTESNLDAALEWTTRAFCDQLIAIDAEHRTVLSFSPKSLFQSWQKELWTHHSNPIPQVYLPSFLETFKNDLGKTDIRILEWIVNYLSGDKQRQLKFLLKNRTAQVRVKYHTNSDTITRFVSKSYCKRILHQNFSFFAFLNLLTRLNLKL
jgi:hypothetical protein